MPLNSREKILAAVKKNQPPLEPLPAATAIVPIQFDNPLEKFKSVLEGIGGVVLQVNDLLQVAAYVNNSFKEGNKYVTTIASLTDVDQVDHSAKAHTLEDVEVAIMAADFAVAENGAVFITASSLKTRALPFICQHLVVLLPQHEIVHTMHQAYERIGAATYDYAVFIAGPSKTADIEQSLVLGAHGPKTMTVCLLADNYLPNR
ncbi:MAG TPA: LUD domain-containing protein [Chitinophagaceae bacterium]|nr:LUD domain-containing protein [Chitinophagaceae bacterium]